MITQIMARHLVFRGEKYIRKSDLLLWLYSMASKDPSYTGVHPDTLRVLIHRIENSESNHAN